MFFFSSLLHPHPLHYWRSSLVCTRVCKLSSAFLVLCLPAFCRYDDRLHLARLAHQLRDIVSAIAKLFVFFSIEDPVNCGNFQMPCWASKESVPSHTHSDYRNGLGDGIQLSCAVCEWCRSILEYISSVFGADATGSISFRGFFRNSTARSNMFHSCFNFSLRRDAQFCFEVYAATKKYNKLYFKGFLKCII